MYPVSKYQKTSISIRTIARMALLSIIALVIACPAKVLATDSNTRKLLLIINSYGENERLTQPYTTPVIQIAAQHKEVECEMEFLNNVLITDSLQYNTVKNNIFEQYKDRQPSYVVFIGNLAFTLRKEVKEKWGDIPMVLISRNRSVQSAENYFSGFDLPVAEDTELTVSHLRPEYNFTALVIPYNYKATVEMMIKLIPDMDELVFMSDNLYLNRFNAKAVRDYLLENYPGIKFTWLKSSREGSTRLQEYLVTELPRTGFLLSTWGYEGKNALGLPTLMYDDLDLLPGSKNPIFTVASNYVQCGALGGVFNDEQIITEYISDVMEKMFAGVPMRDLKNVYNLDGYVTTVNYRLLKRYGLSDRNLPDDTLYYNKPLTFMEKYMWWIIVFAVLLTALITYFFRKNRGQRQRIRMLERHVEFVRHMPIPYSKAVVCYNKDGIITNINYTLKNEAFQEIIRKNPLPDNPFLLFPADFIAEKATDVIRTQRTVRFIYHFDNTDTYYEFTLCLISIHKHLTIQNLEQEDKKEIDVFALNITDRYKIEMKLKEMTEKLDLTLNMAGIIPWDWDVESDTMMFDAYSLFERPMHDFDGHAPIDKRTSLGAINEFFPLINKEDIQQLRDIRSRILACEISEFSELQYRISIVRDGEMSEEWVEVSGTVTKRDKNGKPLLLSGSMMVVTDARRLQINKGELKAKTQ